MALLVKAERGQFRGTLLFPLHWLTPGCWNLRKLSTKRKVAPQLLTTQKSRLTPKKTKGTRDFMALGYNGKTENTAACGSLFY